MLQSVKLITWSSSRESSIIFCMDWMWSHMTNRTEQNRTEPSITKLFQIKLKNLFFFFVEVSETLSCFYWWLKYNFILNSIKHVKTFLEHRNQLSDKLSQPEIINYVPFIINSQDSDARCRKHTSASSRSKWTLKTIKFIWRTETVSEIWCQYL